MRKHTLFVYTRLDFESWCKQAQKYLNDSRSCLSNDPKIVVCICSGAIWICNKVLSYGRLTINFRLVVFTYRRWLPSCGITFLPDSCGDMFYSVCSSLRSASYVVQYFVRTTREFFWMKWCVSFCRFSTVHSSPSTRITVTHKCNQNFWRELGNQPQKLQRPGWAAHSGPP